MIDEETAMEMKLMLDRVRETEFDRYRAKCPGEAQFYERSAKMVHNLMNSLQAAVTSLDEEECGRHIADIQRDLLVLPLWAHAKKNYAKFLTLNPGPIVIPKRT